MSMILENCNNGFFMGNYNKSNKIRPSVLGSNDRTVVRESDHHHHHHPCSSSSSSSIGMNSDGESDDDDEVESNLNNSTFDSAAQALEQALPIRRGISNFYTGKSKSFAWLSEVRRSSMKDIAKPQNAYSRKRKRLFAYSLLCDKDKTSVLKSPGTEGGIMKRSTYSNSRTTLAFAVAMKNSEGRTDDSRIPSLSRPISHVPLPPWRSFSLADLQQCGVSINGLNANSYSPLMGKRTKQDQVS